MDRIRVADLAVRLELDLDRRVDQLSKGNRQKIGLMLAFAPQARLLLLDEPTSGLDPLLQREFSALVREKVSAGVAVALSSHVDLLLAQPISRRSLYLQKFLGIGVGLVVLAAASWLPTAILAGPTGLEIPASSLASETLQLFALATLFASLALAVSSSAGLKSVGIAVAAGVAFVTSLIDGLGQTIDWLGNLRPLLPWRWYDATGALTDGFLWSSFLVLVGASVVVAATGLVLFERRNLRA